MSAEWLLLIAPLLFVALILVERRRQKRLREEMERREAQEVADRVAADQTREVAQPTTFRSFLRGAPTQRITFRAIVAFVHGLVAVGALAWLVATVIGKAVSDPVTRTIILATVGVILLFGTSGLLLRRRRMRVALREHDPTLPIDPT